MSNPDVTILIPNYKTPELTKMCLRLIRKHTDRSHIRVIVIDNNSADASLDYLRSLSWITLIERPTYPEETPSLSHSRALDEAMQQVTTPYVLSIHTDTFIRRDDWLDFLLDKINAHDNIAGVGSWKLEVKPWIKRVLKKIEFTLQSLYFPLTGKGYGKLAGKGDNFLYLRSHCALYRTDLLWKYNLSFSQENDTAGRIMHKKLVEHGYEMCFLPPETLIKYLVHLNHATMLLNAGLGIAKKRKRAIGLKRIQQIFNEFNAEQILVDASLDK